jgi:hypothetical protein
MQLEAVATETQAPTLVDKAVGVNISTRLPVANLRNGSSMTWRFPSAAFLFPTGFIAIFRPIQNF